ncbi:hypothetical protein EB796_017233 [Bugula neritina]|uniref:GAL3ST1 n=1 Tax=Bugula neritina TaxID=10212 RepID=A0A7J7JEB5_BUGNE|nr:hypothetical protein EB796_017233 [Bugula neritina]
MAKITRKLYLLIIVLLATCIMLSSWLKINEIVSFPSDKQKAYGVGARHSHSLKSLAEVKAGGSARHQPLEQEFIEEENNMFKPCEKVTRFVMIKTEKTGSTTLFSILARFILKNKLKVMVMTKGGHLDVTRKRGDHPGWDIGPGHPSHADTLVHHARYNESLLSTVIHPDAKYITLVRDAASWLESAMRFWPGQVDHHSPDELLKNPGLFYQKRSKLKDDYNGQKTLFHLSQLQWLGFDYNKKDNVTAMEEYIKYITSKFHIGFLTDQFDASLIRLRRLFCWTHEDLLYKAQEVGGRVRPGSRDKILQPLSKKGIRELLQPETNLGDQMLYEAFNRTWWNDYSDVKDEHFWQEVEQFQITNAIATAKCSEVMAGRIKLYTIPGNEWSSPIHLTINLCTDFSMDKLRQMHLLATYAIGERYDEYAFVRATDH